ncbi:MAG TPA: DUF2917 domain-containing protein [Anaeromyxobacter sp.]|nr:DUF2917 domain-containing protein [Anaeromyxobacter sp.]
MMLNLSQSQTWSTEVGRAGIEVRVASGEVWITRERDVEDHVLAAPDTFDSTSKGKLVVYAFSPARIEVKPLAEGTLHAGHLAHAVSR